MRVQCCALFPPLFQASAAAVCCCCSSCLCGRWIRVDGVSFDLLMRLRRGFVWGHTAIDRAMQQERTTKGVRWKGPSKRRAAFGPNHFRSTLLRPQHHSHLMLLASGIGVEAAYMHGVVDGIDAGQRVCVNSVEAPTPGGVWREVIAKPAWRVLVVGFFVLCSRACSWNARLGGKRRCGRSTHGLTGKRGLHWDAPMHRAVDACMRGSIGLSCVDPFGRPPPLLASLEPRSARANVTGLLGCFDLTLTLTPPQSTAHTHRRQQEG